MQYLYLIVACMLILSSCADRKLHSSDNGDQKDIAELVDMMTGKFSSEEQALEDTMFYNISLVMFPIWEENQNGQWLYVEQAVSDYLDKPYRQRVYHVNKNQDGLFESKVFELSDPSRFIHGWESPEVFNQITPDSLVERNGCTVFLTKEGDCFSGSTNDKDCKSSLRGAAYATSIVTICQDQIISWDQGWSDDDQQVWGAVKSGYIFKRRPNGQ